MGLCVCVGLCVFVCVGRRDCEREIGGNERTRVCQGSQEVHILGMCVCVSESVWGNHYAPILGFFGVCMCVRQIDS